MPTLVGEAVVLQTPGQGTAFGVRAATEPPVTAMVATITIANPEMVEVVVVDSRIITDGSSSPALAGEGEADSPAATAGG
jgi:hypothetical protein